MGSKESVGHPDTLSTMRDIFPALRKFRNLLLGREYKNSLRNPENMASRDWDADFTKPNLPRSTVENPKLSENDYYTRDYIRAVGPPTVILDAGAGETKRKALEVGDDVCAETLGVEEKTKKLRTPGKVYKYSDMTSLDP